MPGMVDRGIGSVQGRWLGLAPLAYAGSRRVCRMHVRQGRLTTTRGDRREQVARGCCVARRRGAASVSRDASLRRSSDGSAIECQKGWTLGWRRPDNEKKEKYNGKAIQAS